MTQEQKRRERAREDKRALACLRKVQGGELYSMDVVDLCSIPQHRAKAALMRLERLGRATSRLVASPRSGLGRRYYKAVRS